MPLSVFDGDPIVEWHEHYDPDGNLTGRTRIIRPSPWTDRDRLYALELQDREANACHRCGGDLRETLDPRWEWVPGALPYVCNRCAALRQAERAHRDDPRAGAMLHVVHKAPNRWWHLRQQQQAIVDSDAT